MYDGKVSKNEIRRVKVSVKFKAHETFFIRKGWLSKGMRHIANKPDLFVDKNENPMDILGLGSNMVKSLRYWLQATGIAEEKIDNKKHIQRLTENFGQVIFENDRYIEETGTLLLIQYKLASNHDNASAWYYFFNNFNSQEFSREDFIVEIEKTLLSENENVPPHTTISSDFDCIVSTYLPRYKLRKAEVDPENNIDCPLGELKLLDVLDRKKGVYKKATPLVSIFNPWVVLAVIAANTDGRSEIRLNDLLIGKNNIGRVFNLNSGAMLEILYNIEKTGQLKIIRTSGLDVIQLKKNYTFEECVKNYYKDIEK